MRKKIGLVGEDPNDTLAIRNLLLQELPEKFQFKQLIKNKKGYQLNNARTDVALKIEFEDYNPDYVLFIRDADALPSESTKIKTVVDWFKKLNAVVGNRGILLINIYELEALILADIDTFNKLYGTSINYSNNVMYQKEPKEFLIQKTVKNKKIYSESHCPEIFSHLNIGILKQNCTYFKEFYEDFTNRLQLN